MFFMRAASDAVVVVVVVFLCLPSRLAAINHPLLPRRAVCMAIDRRAVSQWRHEARERWRQLPPPPGRSRQGTLNGPRRNIVYDYDQVYKYDKVS